MRKKLINKVCNNRFAGYAHSALLLMAISTEQIKALREKTGVSVMQVKHALEEAGGDEDKAIAILREKSVAIAAKKADRTLGAGKVSAYIHGDGTVGALVELASETDFVANNEEFGLLARDIAMHITAMSPETKEELLEQPFIKDERVTIGTLIEQAVQKFGERIEVANFARFSTRA